MSWDLKTARRGASGTGRVGVRPKGRRLLVALEGLEERVVMASLPMTFSIPAQLAAKGVFVAIAGTLTKDYTPVNGPYANRMLPSGTVVVVSAKPGDPPSMADYVPVTATGTLTQSYDANQANQTISVNSTFQFTTPSGGAGVVATVADAVSATTRQNVGITYTGLTATSLTGVNYYAGPGGGGTRQAYPAGSAVYLGLQNVPMLSLFPSTTGLPQSNAAIPVTIPIPDAALAPVNSGTVVMSVGAPIAISVNGFGQFSAPTPASNPSAKFGLFEWSWTDPSSLDIDVSEVDQVGFPFTANVTNPTLSITGITLDATNNQAVITTSVPHNLQPGDAVRIRGVAGATNLNGTTYVAPPQGGQANTVFRVLLPKGTAAYTGGGTATLLMPTPAQDGVGMTPDRSTLFDAYDAYLTRVAGQFPASNAEAFLRGSANLPGPKFPVGTRITAPQDVLGTVEGQPTFLAGVGVQPIIPINGGSLTPGTLYYYAVTAVGADGGESAATAIQQAPTPLSANVLNWNPFAFAASYNVYRATNVTMVDGIQRLQGGVKLNSAPIPATTVFAATAAAVTLPATSLKVTSAADLAAFPTAGSLILSAPGRADQLVQYNSIDTATTTFNLTGNLGTGSFPAGSRVTLLPNFIDKGNPATTPATPPVNNYGYDPLNQYFSKALVDFFDYYATKPFSIDLPALGTTFQGTVITDENGYKALELTGAMGQSGGQYAGKKARLYFPFFASNTNGQVPGVTSYPNTPTWLQVGGAGITESPSQMVFGCDGVFGTPNAGFADAAGVDIQKDVFNPIATALNRGLTPVRDAQGNWTSVIAPNNWTNFPQGLIASGATATIPSGNQPLTASQYFYAITSLDVNASEATTGETALSNVFPVKLAPGQNAAQLQWKPMNATARASITGSPGSGQVSVNDVSRFPDTGKFLLKQPDGTLLLYTYGSIQRSTTDKSGVMNNVTQDGVGGPAPTSGEIFGNTGGPTVGAFRIYRGTTPDNLTLIATVPNGVPAVGSFFDDGLVPVSPAQAPPVVYNRKGSTTNYYAAFLHELDVSINGLAYGFPYDDQGGLSTNVQMRPPAGVTIALQPWTATTALKVTLPAGNTVTAGQSFQMVVQALKPDGTTDTGYAGTVVIASSDPTVPLVYYTFTKADAGQHTFQYKLKRSGTTVVGVGDPGNLVAAPPASVTVRPGTPVQMSLLRQPTTVLAANQPETLSVAALDAEGNVATSASGPVRVTGPFATRTLNLKNGVADLRFAIARGGQFILQLASAFGNIATRPISVTNTTILRVTAPRTAPVGQPVEVVVTGYRPSGAADPYYSGTVDLYLGRTKVGTASARDGVARFLVTLPSKGTLTLTARDARRSANLGLDVLGTRLIQGV